jgi:multidrug efflux system outer membrane protein
LPGPYSRSDWIDHTGALSGLSVYSWFPTVTAAAGREKAQFSTQDPLAPGGIKTDTYRAGFDASWEIDLFGSLRNEYHAIDRRVEARTASLADAQLSIIAETAQAWFSLIGARDVPASTAISSLRSRAPGNSSISRMRLRSSR